MSQEQESNKKLNRRNFLKASGAVGAGALLPTGLSKAQQPSRESNTVVLTGTPNDPIEKRDIEKIRKKTIQSARLEKPRHRSDSRPIAFGSPVFDYDSDMFVAAYVQKIGQDGKPMTYIGYRSKEDFEKSKITTNEIRRNALYHSRLFQKSSTAFEAHALDKINIKKGGSKDVRIMSPPGGPGITIGDGWEHFGLMKADGKKDGSKMYSHSYLSHFTGEVANTDEELWSMASDYRLEPECYRTNRWICEDIDGFKMIHDYDSAYQGATDVKSVEPHGAQDGDVDQYQTGISVSSEGVSGSISYYYEQPDVNREPLTNQGSKYRNKAGWNYWGISEDVDGEPQEYTLGSAWWFNQDGSVDEDNSCPWRWRSTVPMGRNKIRGTFDEEETVQTSFTVPVEYSITFCGI